MQKKLLGMAVAAVLAVPAVALAQSAVTISGTFKVGIDQYKISNPCNGPAFAGGGCSFMGATGRTGLKTDEIRVTDNSSQIHFNVTEDLGGGMAAIAKLDLRFAPDEGGTANNASGNTWVGIRGAGFGTLTFGRHDLHYGKQPDDVPVKGALMASSVSIVDYAVAGAVPIANTTRTPNVIRWDSPNWGGFNITAAYSTSPFGNEADLGPGGAGGSAWNINPSFTGPNFQIGFSAWDSKADAPLFGIISEMDSQVVYGFFRFGGIKVGGAYHMAKVEAAAGAGTLSKRKAYTVPVSWSAGPHTVAATFSMADDDDELGDGTGAKMWSAMYAFDFSKRTSLSLTFSQIKNDEFAAFDFFTNCGGPNTGFTLKTSGAFGSTASCTNLGEDPTLIALTLRHTF